MGLRAHFYSCMGLMIGDSQVFRRLTVVNGTPRIGVSHVFMNVFKFYT